MCAKVTQPAEHDSTSDEIKRLYQIQTTNFDSVIRVPQLKGLIVSHTGVVGILISYIASLCYNLKDGLRCAKLTSRALIEGGNGPSLPAITISKGQKEKWLYQIEETLLALHGQNFMWRNGNMVNILIDKVTDNAWIVGFRGIDNLQKIGLILSLVAQQRRIYKHWSAFKRSWLKINFLSDKDGKNGSNVFSHGRC